MDELEEILKKDLSILGTAHSNIINALVSLKDYDGLDDEYAQLDLIAQALDDKGYEIENQLKKIVEEKETEESKEERERERMEEDEAWREMKI